MGENPSSAPHANNSNVAGQTSTSSAQSTTSAPSTTGGITGAATATAPSTAQSGATTGAIGSNTGVSANAGGTAGTPGSVTTGIGVNDTATLQNQIQNALQNEPTLRNDNVNVSVTDSTIELSGAVQTGKEKQTAERIASSFAGNRRVKDRITVSGKGSASSNGPNSNNMGANPASNQNNPSNNQQNQNSNDAKTRGDASTNPR
jgi:BON domain